MKFEQKRRGFLALGAVCLLSGCITNPDAVTTENAPRNLAQSGKAYVVYDIHERLGGLLGDARGYGGQFVNIAATNNLLYARTPPSMKLGTGPNHPGSIIAIDPGTYRLFSIGLGKNPCFFDLRDSPVEFTVAAGEVVYLGSVEYQSFRAYNALNPFKTPRFHITFEVNDELDRQGEALAKNLALLPGNPTIHTRLMTIRKPEVLVSSTRKNWFDTSTPKDDWATPAPPPSPQPAAPSAPTPDSSAPWHESPAP